MGFPGDSRVKKSTCQEETRVHSLGLEDPLEKEMAPHSSILAWRIPQREEPGGLQSMGSSRVGFDLVFKQRKEEGTFTFLARQLADYLSFYLGGKYIEMLDG